MSKTKILCHIVFGTKGRRPTINNENKRLLYSYILSILKREKCWLHRLNGIEDHLHMLIDLHPAKSLAMLMKEVKASTSHWMRNNSNFYKFDGWGSGYFAVSVSPENKEGVLNYIKNQEIHHQGQDYLSEIEYIIKCYEMEWYPDDWV